MGICKGKTHVKDFSKGMKRNLLLLSVLILGVAGQACSTPSGPEKASSSVNSNVASRSENEVNEPRNLDTVAQPGSFRDRSKRRNRVDVNPSATPEPPTFRPAPENSESAVTMNADGSIQEIRVFKSHPQLEKVEATWFDPKEKALKVYLKNGQVLDAKTDRIASLQSASSSELLQIAGFKIPQKTGDRPRIAGQK